jgi:hypothetical protein
MLLSGKFIEEITPRASKLSVAAFDIFNHFEPDWIKIFGGLVLGNDRFEEIVHVDVGVFAFFGILGLFVALFWLFWLGYDFNWFVLGGDGLLSA